MPPERTTETYGPGVTAASKSVVVEVMTVLRAYQDALVLVGGWVPALLLEEHGGANAGHVGSIDIDLAVDPQRVNDTQYATVLELLMARGYRQAHDRQGRTVPASLERVVQSPVNQKTYTIRVDFLTPPPIGLAKDDGVTAFQDTWMARKIHGCEAAFAHQEQTQITGVLPDGGGQITVPMRMADVVGCVTMKGIVLGERYREKDAYDLYMVLRHYEGGPPHEIGEAAISRGPRAVAEAVKPFIEEPLVAEALKAIARAFATRQAHGPAWATAFLNPIYREERDRRLTEVFMVAQEFLTHLERVPA